VRMLPILGNLTLLIVTVGLFVLTVSLEKPR
jgi:hypothetical protein